MLSPSRCYPVASADGGDRTRRRWIAGSGAGGRLQPRQGEPHGAAGPHECDRRHLASHRASRSTASRSLSGRLRRHRRMQVPEPLRQAVVRLAADWYEARSYSRGWQCRATAAGGSRSAGRAISGEAVAMSGQIRSADSIAASCSRRIPAVADGAGGVTLGWAPVATSGRAVAIGRRRRGLRCRSHPRQPSRPTITIRHRAGLAPGMRFPRWQRATKSSRSPKPAAGAAGWSAAVRNATCEDHGGLQAMAFRVSLASALSRVEPPPNARRAGGPIRRAAGGNCPRRRGGGGRVGQPTTILP